jgi:hypothetical protein
MIAFYREGAKVYADAALAAISRLVGTRFSRGWPKGAHGVSPPKDGAA